MNTFPRSVIVILVHVELIVNTTTNRYSQQKDMHCRHCISRREKLLDVLKDCRSLNKKQVWQCSLSLSLQSFDCSLRTCSACTGYPTASGWSTSSAMLYHMEHVVLKYTKKQPCVLIWDVYSAHKTDEVSNALLDCSTCLWISCNCALLFNLIKLFCCIVVRSGANFRSCKQHQAALYSSRSH